MKDLLYALPIMLASGILCASSAQDSPTVPARLRVRHELPVEGKPVGLVSFDFTGDGSLELCSVSKNPGGLHVQGGFERGVGTRQPTVVIPIGDYPVGPIISNGELVAGSRAASELYWFNAKSLETKQPRLGIKLESSPRFLVSADLNCDGIELVCVLTKENEILIASADGAVEQTFTAHDQPCSAWALADGRLVIGFQVGREVCVYRRDKSEKSGWSVDWEVQFDGIPRAIRELDLDGDGDRELVIAGGDNEHWVLGLNGNGGSADWIDAEVVAPKRIRRGAIPYSLDSVRRNGRDELFSMAYFEPAWNRIAGNPPVVIEGGYAGQAPVALCTGDFDGDGQFDVAIANSEARRISLLFANDDGSLQVAPQVRTGRAPTALCTADLDGDGSAEAVTLNVLENTYSVVRWNGEALEVLQTEATGTDAGGLAVGDLDSDGRSDLIILRRTSSGGVLSVRFGAEGSKFEQRAGNWEFPVGRSANDVLVLEKNSAREARLCLADPVGDALHVLDFSQAQDREPFDTRQQLSLSSAPTALATLGRPAKGKGERIAVCLAGPGPRTGISIVNLDGELMEIEFLPLAESPTDICSGDFDGDGRLDLGVLALDRGRDGPALFLSFLTRDKGFIPGPRMRTGLRVHSIVAGDLNGDGRDDVVASAQNSHHVNLWLSRKGSPLTFDPQADLGLETGPLGLGLADADGDGQLDLFVANAFANSVSLVLNETAD